MFTAFKNGLVFFWKILRKDLRELIQYALDLLYVVMYCCWFTFRNKETARL